MGSECLNVFFYQKTIMSILSNIPPEHLKVETLSRTPKGGQHVGQFDTGVKITHLPTGLVAICEAERSQFKNRNVALQMLEYGIACLS